MAEFWYLEQEGYKGCNLLFYQPDSTVLSLSLEQALPLRFDLRSCEILAPGKQYASNCYCTIAEVAIFKTVLQHIKLKQEDEAFGGFVQLHTARRTMDGDIRSTTGARAQAHSRQAAEIGPAFACDKDMLHLGQGLVQPQLVGEPLTAFSTVEEISSVVCVQDQRLGSSCGAAAEDLKSQRSIDKFILLLRQEVTCQVMFAG